MNVQVGKALGVLREAGLLVGLVFLIPAVIILLGAPVALLVRLVIELSN